MNEYISSSEAMGFRTRIKRLWTKVITKETRVSFYVGQSGQTFPRSSEIPIPESEYPLTLAYTGIERVYRSPFDLYSGNTRRISGKHFASEKYAIPVYPEE